MAPQYDSDSSAGEEEDFTETNVLLGYASKDPDDDSISRLGGRPEWIDPSSAPSAALARCNICKDIMVLLLQLNAELPKQFPGHERRLYVFACKRKTCRRREGSIRVLRGLRVEPGSKAAGPRSDKNDNKKAKAEEEASRQEQAKPPSNLGQTLFGTKGLGSASGGAVNPFSTSSATSGSSNPFAASSNPFSSAPSKKEDPKTEDSANATSTGAEESAAKDLPKTFAETLSLNNPQEPSSAAPPPEPWPTESEQPAPYPTSYLSDAEYETLDATPPPIAQATTTMDVDEPGSGGGGGKEDKDVFESTMDSAFQKFADRLAQNPEQCIRYEFAGQPLLYSKADAIGQAGGMPRCGSCGGARTFEVQLCPHAITELEAEEMSLEGMDWGTIVVGVCERDCQARGVKEGEAGYLEEWAGVQWEELTASRR